MLYAINSNNDTRTLHYACLIESYLSNCLFKYTENHDNDIVTIIIISIILNDFA